MMYAILVAAMRVLETVVSCSLGAVVITSGVLMAIAVGRWCLSERSAGGFAGRGAPVPRTGAGSLVLAAVLVAGLGCILAGIGLWAR